MTLHIGNDNIVDIRYGNQKIAKVYKGSDLVWGYVPGEVLFESDEAGTYPLYVKCRCKLYIQLVGAGGGGAVTWYYDRAYNFARAGGGSGAYVNGIIELSAGTYNVVVGAGAGGGGNVHAGLSQGGTGGSSSFGGQVAGGGGGGATWFNGTVSGTQASNGAAGVAQTTVDFVNGNQGGAFQNSWGVDPGTYGGASVYGGYGAGSGSDAPSIYGGSGYVKIVAI